MTELISTIYYTTKNVPIKHTSKINIIRFIFCKKRLTCCNLQQHLDWYHPKMQNKNLFLQQIKVLKEFTG